MDDDPIRRARYWAWRADDEIAKSSVSASGRSYAELAAMWAAIAQVEATKSLEAALVERWDWREVRSE